MIVLGIVVDFFGHFGRKLKEDEGLIGTPAGIQIWKRKAEQYLVDSGIPYTIIRQGRRKYLTH